MVAPVDSAGISLKREDSGPAPVQSGLTLNTTIISPSISLPHTFPEGTTKGYIHVIQTSGYNTKAATGASIKISGSDGASHVLREGDGAYITARAGQELKVDNVGDIPAEVLLFDLE